MSGLATEFHVVKWRDGQVRDEADALAEEAPLEIRIRSRAVSVTMRTPGHDAELAAGFLLGEGIIRAADDVLGVRRCSDDLTESTLNVVLSPSVRFDPARLARHVFASSSCGLCGKAALDAVFGNFPPVEAPVRFAARRIAAFPAAMRAMQARFHLTGGLHAAAVLDAQGRLLVLREDIGRHNAVDKVLGHCLLHGRVPLSSHALLVSGRSSFEIMQKALAARVPLVAAVSAPSDLAVDFARESGQTLIGFLRDDRMNIYSHPGRVAFEASERGA